MDLRESNKKDVVREDGIDMKHSKNCELQQETRPVEDHTTSLNVTQAAVHKGEMERKKHNKKK